MSNQDVVRDGRDTASTESVKSRRRVLQAGAALAAGMLAATMLEQQESKAALQLGDVQGESNGPDAGVAGINHADGDGVLGVGHDGPAVRGHTRGSGVAVRAESLTSDAVDAFSVSGRAIHAMADENYAIFGESASWAAIVGKSQTEDGIRGLSTEGAGVTGISENLVGVHGESAVGRGVHGKSAENDGVLGESTRGVGVRGMSSGAAGVYGTSEGAVGVHGSSEKGAGVLGSGASAGVQGISNAGIAVDGMSPNGAGVHGFGGNIGVHGHSANGIGVLAESGGNGPALRVEKGRAHFETAGNEIIPAGSDIVNVGEPLTTAVSHISVTLMDDPAPGDDSPPVIHYVRRKPGVGFTVYLTGYVEVATPISYLVVEPVIYRADIDPSRD